MNRTLAFLYVLPGDAADVGQSFGSIVALEFPRASDGRGAPSAYPELVCRFLKLLCLSYLAHHGTIVYEPQILRARLLRLDVCSGHTGGGSVLLLRRLRNGGIIILLIAWRGLAHVFCSVRDKYKEVGEIWLDTQFLRRFAFLRHLNTPFGLGGL